MQAFTLTQPSNADAAITSASAKGAKYIGGGTDLLQLAKDNVETPTALVDLEPLPLIGIRADDNGLRLEALARMSDVAAHPAVVQRWPVLSQALLASASPQIRNMGTMGGNLLQRTRCLYFRDTGSACNKREPGTGCPAIHGINRNLSILGGSKDCIATHPSDFAVALLVTGATVELRGPNGATRSVRIEDFHRLPGNTPNVETTLQPGELITAIHVPASQAAVHSHYLKVRDRASFEFALVSAAVAMEVQHGTVQDIRIAAGGVAPKPWRLTEVEDAMRGNKLTPALLKTAADAAGQGAKPASQNAFKLVLLRRTVLRALQSAIA
jgi:xanthine dehydrogenase YagS FAD-binding subunit